MPGKDEFMAFSGDMPDKEVLKRAVKETWVRALTVVPPDVLAALKQALERESSERGRRYLSIMLQNAELSRKNKTVICLDTGVPVFFIKTPLGFPFNGSLREVFDEALRELTDGEFPLRSVVVDPFSREDIGGNCARNIPLIYTEIDNSLDHMEILAYPKGSGSGIYAKAKMLPNTAGVDGIKRFVTEAVLEAGTRPCPPITVGVGVGGPMEEVTRLATEAVLRPVGKRNPEPRLAALEEELKAALNKSGIGPMGAGGDTSVLAVNIEYSGTHRPWMPVAVDINCWPGRRAVTRVYPDGRIEAEEDGNG